MNVNVGKMSCEKKGMKNAINEKGVLQTNGKWNSIDKKNNKEKGKWNCKQKHTIFSILVCAA